MSKNISEESAKRSVTATAASPAWRTAKTSPCSVRDVELLDRLVAGPVGHLEQRAAVLAPALGVAAGGQHRPPESRIAAPRRSADISVR